MGTAARRRRIPLQNRAIPHTLQAARCIRDQRAMNALRWCVGASAFRVWRVPTAPGATYRCSSGFCMRCDFNAAYGHDYLRPDHYAITTILHPPPVRWALSRAPEGRASRLWRTPSASTLHYCIQPPLRAYRRFLRTRSVPYLSLPAPGYAMPSAGGRTVVGRHLPLPARTHTPLPLIFSLYIQRLVFAVGLYSVWALSAVTMQY